MAQRAARKQFGRTSADYATSKVHAGGMDLHLLVDAAEPSPGATVLDVGTGAGHTALALAPHVRLVLALDITPEMLAEARRLGATNGVVNMRLIEGAVEAVPVLAGACDIVTCRVAAHHFRAPGQAIAEMARALRPGGRLVLIDKLRPGSAGARRVHQPAGAPARSIACTRAHVGAVAAFHGGCRSARRDSGARRYPPRLRRLGAPLANAAGCGPTSPRDAVVGAAGGYPDIRHHGRAAAGVLALAVHCGRFRS